MEQELVDKIYKKSILLIQSYDCEEHEKSLDLINKMQLELELVKIEVEKKIAFADSQIKVLEKKQQKLKREKDKLDNLNNVEKEMENNA